MNPVLTVLISLLSFALFAFVFGYYAYRKTFYNNPTKRIADPYRHVKDDGTEQSLTTKRLIDEMIARPYDNIYVTSCDGLRLRARLYMQNEKAPFALQMHGYRSTPMLDFSGGGALALELGFNVIMPDERACGESEGRTITFGYKESFDTLEWVRYIGERWGEEREVVLFGVSLGAGTVITAAGRGLTPNVKGVISDCTFSSAKEIVKKVMKDKKIPSLLYSFVRLGALVYGGFDPNKASPKCFAQKIKIPILLIHGAADKFVPPKMSKEICDAAPMAELHIFPNARHGTSYVEDTERYKCITKDYIRRVLGENTLLNLDMKGKNDEL